MDSLDTLTHSLADDQTHALRSVLSGTKRKCAKIDHLLAHPAKLTKRQYRMYRLSKPPSLEFATDEEEVSDILAAGDLEDN